MVLNIIKKVESDLDEPAQSASDKPIADTSTSGGTLVSFHYDALDSLIGRATSNGKEQRFYRNEELVTEIRGSASSAFVRAEDVVLAERQEDAGQTLLLLASDEKNSVLCEVSSQGLQGSAYSAYGHRSNEPLAGSLLGYNGERREMQFGWYVLGNGYRVFNPRLMRFHSPDNLSPFGTGGLNAYQYCGGDPINNVDPAGHTFIGRFLRSFRPTTASPPPGAGEIPAIFLSRPKANKAATLVPLRIKDNKRVLQQAAFYERDVERAELMNSPNLLVIKSRRDEFVNALRYGVKHVGQKVITKHAVKELKTKLKEMASIRDAERAADKEMSDINYAKWLRKIALENYDQPRPGLGQTRLLGAYV